MPWDLALPLTAAGSGAAWARVAATRAGVAHGGSTAVALLGGVAASGLAFAAYEAIARLGLGIGWDAIAAGGLGALASAAVIGLVEEGAKLAGMLLAMDRRAGRPAALATAVGVAAGFAAVEAIVTLRGEPSAPAFARAVLGPVAHALLSLPLAAGISTAATGQARRRLALAAALAAAAALHAAGDLGIALPGAGQLAYPAALAVPALALFRFARRARGPRKEEGPHEADPVTHEEVPRSS